MFQSNSCIFFLFGNIIVLSAVGGIKESAKSLTQGKPIIMCFSLYFRERLEKPSTAQDVFDLTFLALSTGQIAGIAIAILIVLFLVQRFGTDKVGYSFGPIILTWFIFIAGTGVYNLFKHDTGVLKAFNPKYIVDYFERNGKQGWISLGGVILCITGTTTLMIPNIITLQ